MERRVFSVQLCRASGAKWKAEAVTWTEITSNWTAERSVLAKTALTDASRSVRTRRCGHRRRWAHRKNQTRRAILASLTRPSSTSVLQRAPGPPEGKLLPRVALRPRPSQAT